MAQTASARLEFRIRPDQKSAIERTAALINEPVSEFARTAAEEKAEQILRKHEATTFVPPEFFDDLLDAPPAPNAALARASRRAHDVVSRD